MTLIQEQATIAHTPSTDKNIAQFCEPDMFEQADAGDFVKASARTGRKSRIEQQTSTRSAKPGCGDPLVPRSYWFATVIMPTRARHSGDACISTPPAAAHIEHPFPSARATCRKWDRAGSLRSSIAPRRS